MKRILCLLLAVCIFFSIAVIAYADSYMEPESQEEGFTDENGNRAEETQWVFRWWNGLIQKRLWSITYGYWLTDWITVGTYDP